MKSRFSFALAHTLPPDWAMPVPETLAELLDAVRREVRYSSIEKISLLFAEFAGRSADSITLDEFFSSDARDEFRAFLRSRGFTGSLIRSRFVYLGMLQTRAKELGWIKNRFMPEPWRRVLSMAPYPSCAKVVEHFARLYPSPADVTPADLKTWESGQALRRLRSINAANIIAQRFLRLLRDCGYTEQQQGHLRRNRYGVPLEQLPIQLAAEVGRLRRWYTRHEDDDGIIDDWDRENDAALIPFKSRRIKEHAARLLVADIGRIYGFAKNIRKKQESIDRLEELIRPTLLRSFVRWSLNVRQAKSGSLRAMLGRVICAIRDCPAFSSIDLSWSQRFLRALPMRCERIMTDRGARRYLPYEVLESMPDQVRSEINEQVRSLEQPISPKMIGPCLRRIARLSMEELILKWLLILPWRNANIRGCRIGGANPNLFKGKIDPLSQVDRPVWVVDAERENPEAEFWQFHFIGEETKGRREVHCILPRQLIEPLEDFLHDQRSRLLRGNDPGTLFVSDIGTPLSGHALEQLVSDATFRYGGTRVTPHNFRHSVAFAWLKSNPEQYLLLSKILWHADPIVTLNYYATRFNESSGANAMDDWVRQRKLSRQGGPPLLTGGSRTGPKIGAPLERDGTRMLGAAALWD